MRPHHDQMGRSHGRRGHALARSHSRRADAERVALRGLSLYRPVHSRWSIFGGSPETGPVLAVGAAHVGRRPRSLWAPGPCLASTGPAASTGRLEPFLGAVDAEHHAARAVERSRSTPDRMRAERVFACVRVCAHPTCYSPHIRTVLSQPIYPGLIRFPFPRFNRSPASSTNHGRTQDAAPLSVVEVAPRIGRGLPTMKLTSAEASAARPRAGARSGPAVAGPSCSYLQWAACRRSRLIWVFGNSAGLLSSQG